MVFFFSECPNLQVSEETWAEMLDIPKGNDDIYKHPYIFFQKV